MLKAVQNSLLSLIYPQECSVCCDSVDQFHFGNACEKCWSDTRILTGHEMLCKRCGALLGDEAAVVPVSCLKCEGYYFEKAFATGIYEKALAATIVQLKNSPNLNRHLRSLVRTTFETRLSGLNVDLIVPIPLSKARRIERGFNQAEIIAAEVGRASRTAVDNGSLARSVHTPVHRVGVDQKARELTVKNAFEVTRPNLIAGKRILLVDDVLTTGATSSACAKILKKNGTGEVFVFTLARAVMN